MSLVGSLEDLGLGDILQIVSLSRKSGLLMIHSDEGDGRIIFCDGLVRAAFVKGEIDDLRGLLVATGFVESDAFNEATEFAQARGEPLDEIIPQRTSLTRERLDSLRREHVERAVFQVFSWQTGEFSFEVRDEIDPRDAEILLPMGINAQYLTMEATRIDDEDEREPEPVFDGMGEEATGAPTDDLAPEVDFAGSEPATDDEPMFSGEIDFTGEFDESAPELTEPLDSTQTFESPPPSEPPELHDAQSVVGPDPTPVPEIEAAQQAHQIVATAAAEAVAADLEEPPSVVFDAAEPETGDESPGTGVLIAIDANLNALEWQKANLKDRFERVHIFQKGELGIERIRQYLGRGQVPIVLVSDDDSEHAAIGAEGIESFARRLKQQTASLPVLVTYDAALQPTALDSADARIRRPSAALLGNKRAHPGLEVAIQHLRDDVDEALQALRSPQPAAAKPASAQASPAESTDQGLRRLRAASEQMRDPARRGEALSIALEFASESLGRVAIFMLRDDRALGIAQKGLPAAGGPDDDAFRALQFEVPEVDGLARVVRERKAMCVAPDAGGLLGLTQRLGSTPAEAYLAPIESGGRIVAVLYADQLPAAAPIGDTTILEIVLHEAGLALERALLELSLAQTADSTG
jgi:hypothetical protein